MLNLLSRSLRARGAGPALQAAQRGQIPAGQRSRTYARLAPTRLDATAAPCASTRPFTFALSLQLRCDPQSHALQVPAVPPQRSWANLAYRPAPTFWQDLGPLHLAQQPALEALGALQHWLRTSPTGSEEEREASAYWTVCRAQASQEDQTRARLRRGEGVSPRCSPVFYARPLPFPDAQLAPASASPVPAWASAAHQLAALGLIAPALAARAQAEATLAAADEAAAAGQEGAGGARLAGEALASWRSRFAGAARRTAPVKRGGAGLDPLQLPSQAYATCWRELVRAAAVRPESLLPAPGTRRQLAVTLFTEATVDEMSSGLQLRPATGAALAASTHAPHRWDLSLTSVVPDEPGPGATWRLGDAFA